MINLFFSFMPSQGPQEIIIILSFFVLPAVIAWCVYKKESFGLRFVAALVSFFLSWPGLAVMLIVFFLRKR